MIAPNSHLTISSTCYTRSQEQIGASLLESQQEQSSHPQHIPSPEHEPPLVQEPCSLHHGKIWDEHVRPRHGRGIQRRPDCGQRPLAQNCHHDCRHGDAWRRDRHCQELPDPGNHGRCRLRHAHQRQQKLHWQLFNRRRYSPRRRQAIFITLIVYKYAKKICSYFMLTLEQYVYTFSVEEECMQKLFLKIKIGSKAVRISPTTWRRLE